MYTLYHIHKPQKSNTGVTGTQLVDQKLNVGEFSTWRDCSKFFFLQARGQAFQKKYRAAFATPGKILQISPETQNLANYDKASNDLR